MRAWRFLLQSIGALNLLLAAWGGWLWVYAVLEVWHHPSTGARLPYFHAAFWTMATINAAFLPIVAVVSIMLLRLRPKAAMAHTGLFLVMLAYMAAIGSSWLSSEGDSIASATGIGNMGVGPLTVFPVPFVYPVISILCVNIAWNRLKRSGSGASVAVRNVLFEC